MTDWIEHSNYMNGLIEFGYENYHYASGEYEQKRVWRWTAPAKDGKIGVITAFTLKQLRKDVAHYRRVTEPLGKLLRCNQ